MITRKGFLGVYPIRRGRWLYPFISLGIALSLCLGTAQPSKAIDLLRLLLQEAPRIQQVLQLSNLSDSTEVDLGKQMNQQLQGEVRIYRNPEVNRYVQRVGSRLAANSDRPDIPYTFQVVDDDAVNAFATMGGYVYVNRGLLKAAANEAELASVMGHEMGHIEGKHLIKQMRQKAIASGVATVAGLDRNTAVNLGVQLALNLPRSRQDEYDADRRGLITLTRSGYAQSAMVSFMQKLQGKSSVPTLLSTHPGTSDRINSLKQQISSMPSNGNYGLNNAAYQTNVRAFIQ